MVKKAPSLELIPAFQRAKVKILEWNPGQLSFVRLFFLLPLLLTLLQMPYLFSLLSIAPRPRSRASRGF